MLNPIEAISAVDGRYQSKTQRLSKYLSEAALIRYRLMVEARWLKRLADTPDVALKASDLTEGVREHLDRWSEGSSDEDVSEVKRNEQTTNHDVKAVEYLMRTRLEACGASKAVLAHIHFACTSEDINNLAYGMMMRDARDAVLLPQMRRNSDQLWSLAENLKGLPMLSRTHGQTATPSTLGKEIAVFAHRLDRQLGQLAQVSLQGKINGATGGYNAHVVAYPLVDWPKLAREFVEKDCRLEFNPITTQIENHDSVAEYLDALNRCSSILIDLCRDIWQYISLGYFRQKLAEGEVGSSTMPHKVNPIDFENAEGNLGVARALAGHLSEKLPISRLQRDLSDSTVLRTLGTVLGHVSIACQSCSKGLGKLQTDAQAVARDLEECWEVLAEPLQTVLRKHGQVDAYEQLKGLSRGKAFDKDSVKGFIDGKMQVFSDEDASRLSELTPGRYTGLSERLVEEALLRRKQQSKDPIQNSTSKEVR